MVQDYRIDPTVNELLRANDGTLKRIPNPSNPKLYSIVWVRSKIMVYMTRSNPSRTPTPLPLNACCLGGPIVPGGGSKNKRSKKKPKKLREDLWGT